MTYLCLPDFQDVHINSLTTLRRFKTPICAHTYRSIFYLQIEPPQGFGDDTSLNRVSLSCRDAETLEETGNVTPYSDTRSFGSWGSETSCHKGQFLTSFALQVEKPQVWISPYFNYMSNENVVILFKEEKKTFAGGRRWHSSQFC